MLLCCCGPPPHNSQNETTRPWPTQVRQLLWKDDRFRASFAAHSASHARQGAATLLQSLRGIVNGLRPAHLVPEALFSPPGSVFVTSSETCPRARSVNVHTAMFEMCPITTLLRMSDVPQESAAGAVPHEEGGGGDVEDVDDHDEMVAHGSHGVDDSDDGSAASDVFVCPPDHDGYIVHHNYGNDTLQSQMRVELYVRECPLLFVVRRRCLWEFTTLYMCCSVCVCLVVCGRPHQRCEM